ncbi:MAG: ribonuclease P protein component [Pseudonocardiales bacterium]|nr:ribonuclease P protein component [Pseudonocardiales bacterium]MBV9031332.1 ribonuclease P protein component [Pseudonocardiales bacterium]MBW0011043.1 ribonuclease P protein component [Pseudonocardiales bacterium]
MLSAASRLTRREDFATAMRRGRRATCGCVVVHLVVVHPARGSAGDAVPSPVVGPRIGFVVGRTVGGSVVRHRVQRRLRHLMRWRLASLPAGALVVVRALPASAGASSAALGADLDGALRRLVGSRTAGAPGATSLGGRR